MATFNVHEAKTHFSRLLDRVLEGEEIVITRNGHPVAQLMPARPASCADLIGTVPVLTHRADDLFSAGEPEKLREP